MDFLEGQLGAQLRAQGFNAAAIVMLGGLGAGTSQRGGFWARFVMLEGVGVWAMELMHCLTGFDDLYPFKGNFGGFDEMACSCGTHPSAYTKAAIGWLDLVRGQHREGDSPRTITACTRSAWSSRRRQAEGRPSGSVHRSRT